MTSVFIPVITIWMALLDVAIFIINPGIAMKMDKF